MPELIMERPKMSLQMHENLKKYILRERKKKKEEDVANEQKMQKMKEEMKKVEMNTQTMEQTKEQIKHLEIKLEELQHKKRELFCQLKKVLNEENIMKKRPMQTEPLFQPVPYQPSFQPSPMRFISAPNRPLLFKPESVMQPQAIKRARSPSPTQQTVLQPVMQGSNQQVMFQAPQHPNLLSAAVTNSQFQSHIFSPNKKSRVGPPQANTPQMQPMNSYASVIVGQQLPQRLPAPYNSPQQSAFSAYPSHFMNALQQSQQQKATILGVQSNSHLHGPPGLPYGLSPRLSHQGAISIPPQLDQKMLFQSQQLLMSHPQSGGILAGYPLQRPTQPSPHQQQSPYQ